MKGLTARNSLNQHIDRMLEMMLDASANAGKNVISNMACVRSQL